jgi:hypothetical protein
VSVTVEGVTQTESSQRSNIGVSRHIAGDIHHDAVAQILELASAPLGSLVHLVHRVDWCEVVDEGNWSIAALVVAPPLCSVAYYEFVDGALGTPVVQTFKLSQILEVVSAGELVFAVLDVPAVEVPNGRFTVQGPLLQLPKGTSATDVMLR